MDETPDFVGPWQRITRRYWVDVLGWREYTLEQFTADDERGIPTINVRPVREIWRCESPTRVVRVEP